MDKRYSVLMSVYYKEKPEYLRESVNSMLHQTIMPDQIVIVEDGELTNDLKSIIDSYKNSYHNLFTIISLKENVGLGRALNMGLIKCRNPLVARMDTDDISLPQRCELQLNEFNKNNNLSILGTNIDEFYDDPLNPFSTRVVPETNEGIKEFAKRRSPFNHPTVMYKKEDVLSTGGYGDLRRNQDYDLFVRMLNDGFIAKNINKSLLLFRANKENYKRRKSWDKCKGDIKIRYKFWKKGYLGLFDLLIASSAFLISFISPSWIFEMFSDNILRKKLNK